MLRLGGALPWSVPSTIGRSFVNGGMINFLLGKYLSVGYLVQHCVCLFHC